MTMSKLVQALIVFVLFCRVHAETEEDYYVNLVHQEIANALTYQLPNDAKEYQATIDDIEGIINSSFFSSHFIQSNVFRVPTFSF